jgi:hypothetical protein
MTVETSSDRARGHLHEMISLANRLISESVNQSDPIEPPQRTISKADFSTEYLSHSAELCRLLEHLSDDEDGPPVDDQLAHAREELAESLGRLQVKPTKLNDLRFWMNNLIVDKIIHGFFSLRNRISKHLAQNHISSDALFIDCTVMHRGLIKARHAILRSVKSVTARQNRIERV